jgi:hypothetical protein
LALNQFIYLKLLKLFKTMPVLTQTKIRTNVSGGLAIGVVTLCIIGAVIAVGFSFIPGVLPATIPGNPQYLSCGDTDALAGNDPVVNIPAAIINQGPQHFNPFRLGTVTGEAINALGYRYRSAYTDKCYKSFLVNGKWVSRIVTSCSSENTATERDCRIQEGYCKTAGSEANRSWSYAYPCANGCNAGACINNIVTPGVLTVNLDGSNPSSRSVAAGTTGITLTEVRLKAINGDINITKLTVSIANGIGASSDGYVNIAKV